MLISSAVQATTYYVSATGSDLNNGTSIATAWQTLSKVSGATFAPDDQILFQRGDTWYGMLTVHDSGTSGHPITYGAYGTGENPIITGFTNATGFTETSTGSHIWESAAITTSITYCNMVVINGVNTAMGREPELGSYYTYQSHSGDVSITSTDLTGTPDWTGAQVVNRKRSWIWQTDSITSQSGSTINYSTEGGFSPQDNWGFFIQNDIRTLDSQNEWFYNPSTKKISVYSTSQPTNVKVASVDYLFYCAAKNYVTVTNISFIGSNTVAVRCSGNYDTVSNCFISYSGLDGIMIIWGSNGTADNNIIKNSNYRAIYGGSSCNYATASNNTIDSTSMIIGIGLLYAPSAIITESGDFITINGNKIDHSGYNGIQAGNSHATINNNFINHSLLNRSDGAGIYVGGNHADVIIDSNIVLNSFGDTAATNGGAKEANGIYLDASCNYVTASNNTCAYNGTSGIYLNGGATYNTVSGNTSFDNASSQFRVEGYGIVSSNNTVTNNKFIAKSYTELVVEYRSTTNNIPAFFSSSDNNYFARPIDDAGSLKIGDPDITYKTLAQWKTYSGKDASSTKSPQKVNSESEFQFEYNNTSAATEVTLTNRMIGLSGTKYRTGEKVTIPPFSSVVLLRDLSTPKFLIFGGKTYKF